MTIPATATNGTVRIDDAAHMVFCHFARHPSDAEVHEVHSLAGELGYGIRFTDTVKARQS